MGLKNLIFDKKSRKKYFKKKLEEEKELLELEQEIKELKEEIRKEKKKQGSKSFREKIREKW